MCDSVLPPLEKDSPKNFSSNFIRVLRNRASCPEILVLELKMDPRNFDPNFSNSYVSCPERFLRFLCYVEPVILKKCMIIIKRSNLIQSINSD